MRGLTAAARAGRLPPATTAAGQPSHVVFGSGEELSRALNSQQWGRPLALGAVMQDAVERREFIPLDDFLNATKSVYAKSWIPSPWQVVSWGLKQVGVASLFGASDKLSVGNLVVMANVEVLPYHSHHETHADSSTTGSSKCYHSKSLPARPVNDLLDLLSLPFRVRVRLCP